VTRLDGLLARSPWFESLPAAALASLAARATRRKVRRGQRALGRHDAFAIVVVTGRLEVRGDDGFVVRSIAAPATIGVSVAVLAGSPARTASVTRGGAASTAELWAAEDAELVVVPADAVAATVRRHPETAITAIAHLARIVGELSAEIEALRKHGLAERIRHRLAQLGRGRREVAITHERLADEVGGTRANVSRALARLEREGAIRRYRGRIALI
jgi:CRP-like cAMP-binding protein